MIEREEVFNINVELETKIKELSKKAKNPDEDIIKKSGPYSSLCESYSQILGQLQKAESNLNALHTRCSEKETLLKQRQDAYELVEKQRKMETEMRIQELRESIELKKDHRTPKSRDLLRPSVLDKELRNELNRAKQMYTEQSSALQKLQTKNKELEEEISKIRENKKNYLLGQTSEKSEQKQEDEGPNSNVSKLKEAINLLEATLSEEKQKSEAFLDELGNVANLHLQEKDRAERYLKQLEEKEETLTLYMNEQLEKMNHQTELENLNEENGRLIEKLKSEVFGKNGLLQIEQAKLKLAYEKIVSLYPFRFC